jgi:hypothetical protein
MHLKPESRFGSIITDLHGQDATNHTNAQSRASNLELFEQVHFAQKDVVAPVGAQGVVDETEQESEYHSVAFVERFLSRIQAWIDIVCAF